MEQAAPDDSSPSLLLRCLSQLDTDTWAQVLLPLLVEQGSAGAVALACSALRELCHSSVQELKLMELKTLSPDGTGGSLEAWGAAALPDQFSSSTRVSMRLGDAADCNMACLLTPLLDRLPRLNTIDTEVHVPTSSLLYTVAPFLHAMRTQLRSLRDLGLDINHSWLGGGSVWAELGLFTQLTTVRVESVPRVNPCTGAQLALLGGLASLQQLVFDADPMRPAGLLVVQPQGFLSDALLQRLTALTRLEVDPCSVDELPLVSQLTNLQDLFAACPDGAELELQASHWASLAQLTRLTELNLFNATARSASPESGAALGQLKHLQAAGMGCWAVSILAQLTVCTGLTRLDGWWAHGVERVSLVSIKLLSVVEMLGVGGPVPFEVCPNLTKILHSQSMDASALACVGRCLPQLRELLVHQDRAELTLPLDTPYSTALGAISGLTALSQLTALDSAPQDDMQLVGVVAAAQQLVVHGSLCSLYLRLVIGSDVTCCGLMQLARLSGVQVLELEMCGGARLTTADEARMLLCSLSGAKTVVIHTATQAQYVVLQVALRLLCATVLPTAQNTDIRAPAG